MFFDLSLFSTQCISVRYLCMWFVFSVSLTHHQSVMDVCTREGRIAVFLCYLMFVTSAFDSQQQHPIHKEREREKKRQRERETNSSIIIIIIEHERIISLYPHISSSVHSLSPASFSWTTRRLLCCCCCHSFLSLFVSISLSLCLVQLSIMVIHFPPAAAAFAASFFAFFSAIAFASLHSTHTHT